MKQFSVEIGILVLFLCANVFGQLQQIVATNTNLAVPPLVNFSGALTDVHGKPLTGAVQVTFCLYKDEQGGPALWMETQNVQPDSTGHYSVMLGSTGSTGLPADVFASGEAHWLAVQPQGQAEYPRVLLVSVPYALKAGDAQTVGGLPPSAFVLAAPSNAAGASTTATSTPATPGGAIGSTPVTTAGGTISTLPLWDSSSDITNSVITQSGSGATARIGINTTTPASTLDIKGGSTVRGTLSLPAAGVATSSKGANSQPQTLAASSFNSSTLKAVNQTFQWQAEPAGNNTTSPSGTLNLLFGSGVPPAETGLHIGGNGQITFAPGQTFPGTGSGTVTSVASGLGLTGGPITGSGTLTIDTSVVPQLNVANTFTANQMVNGNLSATGVVTGSGFQIGSTLFDYGSFANANAFLGFAGNTITTGVSNTAIGVSALLENTTGGTNTASGVQALFFNSSGDNNTASGFDALFYNSTGAYNTAAGEASGVTIDASHITGFFNTFVGANSAMSTGTLTNATAIGANAEVAGSNAIVLGSISGVNGATASTNVGIGTTTPDAPLNLGGGQWNLTNTEGDFKIGNDNIRLKMGVALTGGGAGDSRIRAVGGTNRLLLGTGASDVLTLSGSSVGIGTNTPDNLLSVNGTADKPGGGSWGTFSDRRLKTLHGNFNSGLDKVLKINPIRYRYKEDNPLGIRDADEHIGLVAQEVQKVIPEAVTENSRGFLLVNNDPIIWAMLNAIKQQQSLIQQQQKRIAQLTSQVRAIRTSLSVNGRTGSGVRPVKADRPPVRQ